MQRPEKDRTKLSREVEKLTQRTAETFESPEAWQAFCESLSLQVRHQGEHVAFRDHWEAAGNDRRLAYREIISHSRNLSKVQKDLRDLSEEELAHIHLTYTEENKPITR